MTAQNLIDFRDAVADEVSKQYPKIDYLNAAVARAIERKAELIGWAWMADGPVWINNGGMQ